MTHLVFSLADGSGITVTFKTDLMVDSSENFTIMGITGLTTDALKRLFGVFSLGKTYHVAADMKTFATDNGYRLDRIPIGKPGATSSNLEVEKLGTPVLVATAVSGTEIDLSLSADIPNATRYKFERATNAGFTTGVTTLQNTSGNTYSDTGRTINTTYYYRVTAHTVSGTDFRDSDASTIVAKATFSQLATPAPSITAHTSTSQTLDWADVTNATGYVVDRATNVGFTTGVSLAVYEGSASTAAITGLTTGTTYYYRVRATAVGYVDSVNGTATGTTD
jgi:hypothetical protein